MNGSFPDSRAKSRAIGRESGGAAQLIELLRTLADPIRLRIVRLMEAYPPHTGAGNTISAAGTGNGANGGGGSGRNVGEAGGGGGGFSVGELGEILKLPQSTVSRHLKMLSEVGLVEPRRDGTSMYYRLAESAAQPEQKQLRQLARTHLEHDSLAQNDASRLAVVLRKRESALARGGGGAGGGGGVDSYFGKNALRWDHIRAQWFGDTFHLEAILALLNPAWVVADIGTGTGTILPLLAPHVKQVIGVDPTAAMLKAARARVQQLALANVDIRQGTGEKLPVDAASADVALLALVLAYTVDPELVFREIHRILKPGGTLLIIDLQPHTVELFREKLSHRWMGFAREQMVEWLSEAGFTQMRWHPLAARQARSKESSTPVPDLFAIRAEVAHG